MKSAFESKRIAALLVLLLLGLGCKSAERRTVQPNLKRPQIGRYSEETIQRGWITIELGLPKDAAPPFPLVLNPILPDEQLLRRGIGVVRWKTHWEALNEIEPAPAPTPVSPEPTPATEPVGAWILRSPRPGVIGQGYFQLITSEAHQTVPAVVDHLSQNAEIDVDRIAITGSSTGGFTALQAFAEDPRFSAAAVQVACGEYRLFLKSSRLALDDQERWLVDGEMVLDADYATFLDAVDPATRADLYPPRPLLLVSGAEDRAIPPACVHATAARFSEVYERAGAADEFLWIEFPDRGHNLGPEASREVLAFLEKNLLGPVSPTSPASPLDAGSPSSGSLHERGASREKTAPRPTPAG